MTYDQALAEFVRTHPGTSINSIDPDAFNQWSAATYGPGGFESAPTPVTTGLTATGPTVSGNPTAVNIFGDADPRTALAAAIAGAPAAPNTMQVQGGQQSGFYDSSGITSTKGAQTEASAQQAKTTGTERGVTSGTSETLGTTAGTTTGVTKGETTGATTEDVIGKGVTTGTTRVADTLGLGKLLAGQAGPAAQADAARQAFLQELVTQGPKQQQALTSAAVNQALSGPGMFGTGQGAQTRAATQAASQVGLQSLNQQLQAAQQLAGPSATTTLVGAGTPYLGQDTTGTTASESSKAGTQAGASTTTQAGQQAGTTSQTGATSQISDLSKAAESLNIGQLLKTTDMSSAESQKGTSGNVGTTAGIGTVPENQTTSGGGCFVCTVYVDNGWKANRAVRAAARYKLSRPEYRRSLAGYSVYGPTLARLIQRNKLFAKLFFPVARAVLFEELRLAGKTKKGSDWASLCHHCFHYGSLAVAVLTGQREIKMCDRETYELLQRNNLFLEA
jgi:hypothetical protein